MGQTSILNTHERKLLGYAEFQAQLTADKLARLTHQHSSKVAYTLRRLKEHGVIQNSAVINYTRLGYTNVAMFFSLRTGTKKQHEHLRAYLVQDKRIAWFGALAGDYQYGMAILVKTVTELGQFVEELSRKFDQLFAQKIIAPRLAITLFNRAYLNPERKGRDSIDLYSNEAPLTIDATDSAILRILTNTNFDSFRDVARKLGLPASTVERRIGRLSTDGVIARFIYGISATVLGAQWYRLLLFTQGLGPLLREKLKSYAVRHPHILMFVESVGAWDFELEVELSDARQLVKLSQELHELCGSALEAIRVLSEIEDYKLNFFPIAER